MNIAAALRNTVPLLFTITSLVSCQRPPDSSGGTLTDAAPMSVARAVHTATTLLDGRVLIVGGFTEQDRSLVGAEIHDPETGQFTPAGPTTINRHSHTATLLPSGKVLIAGGFGAGNRYLSETEIFDPATNSFTAAGAMPTARSGHTATLLTDGSVLLIGGTGTGWSFLSSADRYDPVTDSFTSAGSMSVARESHAAMLLPSGEVLVVGGHAGRRQEIVIHASAEVWDPTVSQFRPTGPMNIRRHKHDATMLVDGSVLVTGGADERDDKGTYDSAELRDPVTGVFRTIANLKHRRYKHQGSSQLLRDGRVAIVGGAERAEIFDPATGQFQSVGGPGRMAGQFSATALLKNGQVLITGGYGSATRPTRGSWLLTPSVPPSDPSR